MMRKDKSLEQLLATLQERAKELNCLYRVDEILNQHDTTAPEVFDRLVEAIPAGWQYPQACVASLSVDGGTHRTTNFVETPWVQSADINSEGEKVGNISVYYTEEKPIADEGPFLKEERRLINTIADRIGVAIIQRRLRNAHDSWENTVQRISTSEQEEWVVIIDFLRRTDPKLLVRITRKMINQLCWTGAKDADRLLQEFVSEGTPSDYADDNRPMQKTSISDSIDLTERTFGIAAQHFSDAEMISYLQTWIEEDKTAALMATLETPHSGLSEIAEALARFESTKVIESQLPIAVQKNLRVSLIRRFFTDELSYIDIASKFVRVKDFYHLMSHLIHPAKSHGKLGGKSAGLFMAYQIIKKSKDEDHLFANLKTPKTWYISSDTLQEFMHHNNLEDLYNRKYVEIDRIRSEYPHIVQVFKNSQFPPDIKKGLAVALDDFKKRPLIVRSSSLLEDRFGSAFSGKYKSLFLANQGTKNERLAALQDAIAEVYASIFGPDPIEYRTEMGLLDVHEEMGIMIQEVVGHRCGKYFFPAFSGVAFSNNEFRWSPRIEREDGLVRMVPGLGTRAVDRVSDDYPVLVAPGQPNLRVNVTVDEIVRYSPKKMDVINLEENRFETVAVQDLLREVGDEYPQIRAIISIVDGDRLRKPRGLEPDWDSDELAVTFEGVIGSSPFIKQVQFLLHDLRERLDTPVDIEFASDGADFYLLQCRAQSHSAEYAPASIPQDVAADRIIFSGSRYVSNGRVLNISHIVYVDPERYSEITDIQTLRDVGRAVGRLNKLLPKRQFILLGPGRWGSRGDIRLGVNVTYSDISNTAALLEIAHKKGNYVPELSFGTHFFQDLVEADIRYLPLYPDETGNTLNEVFLRRAQNILADLLPEFSRLADVLRVIDVPRVADGHMVQMLMNAELQKALGIISLPSTEKMPSDWSRYHVQETPEDHWRWRLRMAEKIGQHLDPDKFGVKGLYVFGSTKNATAGPSSDLDLIVHVTEDEEKQKGLSIWLDGWSQSLAETNYLRTGYRSDGILDVHFVTDRDIADKTSFAAKIGAVTDAARPLPLKRR